MIVSLSIAVLMWTLVLVLLVFRRGRKERSVTLASTAIALAMMMSIDELYLIVDGWAGGNDYLHPVSCVTLMVGMFFLARAVIRTGGVSGVLRFALGLPALIVATVIVVVAFLFVDRPHRTSTTFMLDYGDQLAAAVYSAAQYVYLFGVLASLVLVAVRQLNAGRTASRVAAALIAIGSTFGVLLAVDVIAMDITNVTGWDAALEMFQAPYGILQVMTFLFLCSGLAFAPLGRWRRERLHRKTTLRFLDRVHGLWQSAAAARQMAPEPEVWPHAVEPEDRLHRWIVEIRDAAIDASTGFTLHPRDRHLLEHAERHLTEATA